MSHVYVVSVVVVVTIILLRHFPLAVVVIIIIIISQSIFHFQFASPFSADFRLHSLIFKFNLI